MKTYQFTPSKKETSRGIPAHYHVEPTRNRNTLITPGNIARGVIFFGALAGIARLILGTQAGEVRFPQVGQKRTPQPLQK